ncbi:hypothetical protein [Luteimonas sp. MC1572]|uniref:hypothetical protein n=1 Tax=Luteimonas sp. MC1572 TaxID=2799325 RepID=UPI0018F067AB|nr:hypothetical protein [Luteimonas sp. MC1572]MBJ6981662.1 hypothetical protein [Luteimonas sp. MC1572]QQO02954.1 hypothetical protein JGR64_12455 [Luteimonas sp. MC1572]
MEQKHRGRILDFDCKVVAKRGAGLEGLKPVLRSWTERTYDFCRLHAFEDNPWWYNERASLSVLAAAAWSLKGWCALEEYSTTKRGVVPSEKVEEGSTKRGRCDLWLGNRTGYALEAKQAWQSIGVRARGLSPIVWAAHERAWNDAGALTADEAHKRVAAVFVSPYIALSEVALEHPRGGRQVDRAKLKQKVTDWLGCLDLASRPEIHAYAWVFPLRTDGYAHVKTKCVFPGSLLLLSERKRGNRRT